MPTGRSPRFGSASKGFLLVQRRHRSPPSRLVETSKITADQVRSWKAAGVKVPTLTAYDYPMARLLDEAGVPVLLVGDSLGMVVLGFPDTTHVTLDHMAHHVAAVARAKPRALVVGDMPYRTYDDPVQAAASARRLADAGAEAVKMEGGREITPQIRAIRDQGIAVMGHLGMLPQHLHEEGGKYRIKGRDPQQRDALLRDAAALVDAGVFAIVLELVTPPVAEEITKQIPVPTIGIGSGTSCDGQVLVTSDLLGTFPWFTPRFVTPRLDGAARMRDAVLSWTSEVRGSART